MLILGSIPARTNNAAAVSGTLPDEAPTLCVGGFTMRNAFSRIVWIELPPGPKSPRNSLSLKRATLAKPQSSPILFSSFNFRKNPVSVRSSTPARCKSFLAWASTRADGKRQPFRRRGAGFTPSCSSSFPTISMASSRDTVVSHPPIFRSYSRPPA